MILLEEYLQFIESAVGTHDLPKPSPQESDSFLDEITVATASQIIKTFYMSGNKNLSDWVLLYTKLQDAKFPKDFYNLNRSLENWELMRSRQGIKKRINSDFKISSFYFNQHTNIYWYYSTTNNVLKVGTALSPILPEVLIYAHNFTSVDSDISHTFSCEWFLFDYDRITYKDKYLFKILNVFDTNSTLYTNEIIFIRSREELPVTIDISEQDICEAIRQNLL